MKNYLSKQSAASLSDLRLFIKSIIASWQKTLKQDIKTQKHLERQNKNAHERNSEEAADNFLPRLSRECELIMGTFVPTFLWMGVNLNWDDFRSNNSAEVSCLVQLRRRSRRDLKAPNENISDLEWRRRFIDLSLSELILFDFKQLFV